MTFCLGLSEDDYEKLITYLTLSPINSNDQILAAGCNLIASLCSDELARHNFGEKITVYTVNLLKSFTNCTVKDKPTQEYLRQACRAIGNLCYYHGKKVYKYISLYMPTYTLTNTHCYCYTHAFCVDFYLVV